MSQFTDSLKKKQREVQNEHAELSRKIAEDHARLAALSGALAGIESLLRLEGVAPESIVIQPMSGSLAWGANAPQLYDVVFLALNDKKPHTAAEILEIAKSRGVAFGDKDPLKAVGMTLLGISRSKKFKHHDNGSYQRIAD